MADRLTRQVRRGLIALVYGLTTALLLHIVAEDVPWVGEILTGLAATVPPALRPVDASVGFAIVLASAFAIVLALGAFFLSRRTGTGFGLLTAASVAWISFPYARLPFSHLLDAPPGETYTAPATVWILAGGLVCLATIEMGICARERVLHELDRRGLTTENSSTAARLLRTGTRRWLATSLLAGSAIVLAFALLHPVTERLAGNLDLLWVPALAGLIAGAALWLWARD